MISGNYNFPTSVSRRGQGWQGGMEFRHNSVPFAGGEAAVLATVVAIAVATVVVRLHLVG